MTNPLLVDVELPSFERIQAEHVEPAIDKILADNRTLINELVKSIDTALG